MKVNIELEDAESVSHNISDLLCWWQGFKTGMEHNQESFNPVAEHGIETIRKINVLLKSKIQKK